MAVTNKYKQVDPRLIVVPADRQRKGGDQIDTTDIDESIARRGILHPLIVEQGTDGLLSLLTGERRLRSALKQGLGLVPVRLASDLAPLERKIIELEENERRKDLPWRDHCAAVAELHAAYGELARGESKTWSVDKTGEELSYSPRYLFKLFRVAKDLENPRLKDAPSLFAAYNILERIDERITGDVISDLMGASRTLEAQIEPKIAQAVAQAGQVPAQALAKPVVPTAQFPAPGSESTDILQVDFITWAEGYVGERFNLIHCDFPYGTNVFGGPQSGRDKWAQGTYDDDPGVYWSLIRALCENLDKFMSQSGHLVFWLSADVETMGETLEAFAKAAPSLVFWPKPLIWLKSDNVGIISDPKRGPRHIYETALVAARGDRPVLMSKSDAYSAPTNKDHHPSTKPESVLRHFFEMFVDEQTRLLDPTCGGGSALRAAESMGAKRVLGLEVNPEHCASARMALKQFRSKASLAKRISKNEKG